MSAPEDALIEAMARAAHGRYLNRTFGPSWDDLLPGTKAWWVDEVRGEFAAIKPHIAAEKANAWRAGAEAMRAAVVEHIRQSAGSWDDGESSQPTAALEALVDDIGALPIPPSPGTGGQP